MVSNKDWIREVEFLDTQTILKETLHDLQVLFVSAEECSVQSECSFLLSK